MNRVAMALLIDDANVIIALDNIDEEVRQKEELKSISEKSVIFTHIAESLANQYGMSYYIDTDAARQAYAHTNISADDR